MHDPFVTLTTLKNILFKIDLLKARISHVEKSEAKKSTEMDLSLTIFERFYGQICLQKLLKYGQTQPLFAHFFASLFGLM